MNETNEEITQEQRKAVLSSIMIHYRNSSADVYGDVAAYQLMDAVLIIAQQDGTTYLVPMDTVASVRITQNKE